MASLKKAILYGFVIWFIPFVVAAVIFPLRESNRPLFESIMPVAVALAVAWFGVRYMHLVTEDHAQEGLHVGLVWMAVSLLIDAPLMLLGGPMQMTLMEYVSDIGVTYVMMPVITTGIGAAAGRVAHGHPRDDREPEVRDEGG